MAAEDHGAEAARHAAAAVEAFLVLGTPRWTARAGDAATTG